MVHKGGTLRLRVSELKAMAGMVLTVLPNQSNPDVVHFGVITQEEAAKQVAAFAELFGGEPPKEESDGQPE
jgi:hypothetical protein